MIFDDSLPEFIPGTSGSNLPVKFAPPGLPPMYPVLSDPTAPSNRMEEPVRKWRLSKGANSGASSWSNREDEPMHEQLNIFQGEESLIPDTIAEELWQSHFRQHDAELNDRKETEYLMQLYKQSSGRWPVIYDRWQMHPVYGLRGKSIESLKSKFNKVAMKLIETDVLLRKRPSTTMERFQVTQHLKFLPIFAMKYNEKNEYLRRLFLENAFKRPASPDQDRWVNEIMRIPTLSVKKKGQQAKPPVIPGPHLASSLNASVQSEISSSEYTRVKAVLRGLGIDKTALANTPAVAKLMAVVEKEAAALLMMRDSLQRKKQELEILRTSGGNGVGGMRMRPPPSSTSAPTSSASTPAPGMHMQPQSISISQQKRKR